MNRRGSTRVAVRLTCRVLWLEGGECGTMLTENISRDGMLLRWEDGAGGRLPAVGEMLVVEVELPEQEGFERRCIRCQTTVARVHDEPGGSFTWVGLRIHAMDFRVAQPTAAHCEAVGFNGRGSRAF